MTFGRAIGGGEVGKFSVYESTNLRIDYLKACDTPVEKWWLELKHGSCVFYFQLKVIFCN